MTIAEVSKKFDITPDTLRYYERINLLPDITRNKNGIRNYSEHDLGWVQFIKCMRDAGVSIEILLEYVRLFNMGDKTIKAREKLLIEQRNIILDKLNAIEETLKKLDVKIDLYKTGKMKKCEPKLVKKKN